MTEYSPQPRTQVFLVERLDTTSGDAMLHLKVRRVAVHSRRAPHANNKRPSASCALCPRTSPCYAATSASPSSGSITFVRTARCRPSAARSVAEAAASVFTNILRDSYLHELADADDGELVKQVQARHEHPCQHARSRFSEGVLC